MGAPYTLPGWRARVGSGYPLLRPYRGGGYGWGMTTQHPSTAVTIAVTLTEREVTEILRLGAEVANRPRVESMTSTEALLLRARNAILTGLFVTPRPLHEPLYDRTAADGDCCDYYVNPCARCAARRQADRPGDVS